MTTKTAIQFILLFFALVLIQIIGSKILLFGLATPIIFIYLILRLPINFSLSWTFTIAFFMGLVIDVFNNTPGMNALACTLLAAMRRPVFNTYFTRDDDDTGNPMPAIDTLGLGSYLKYMTTLVLAYSFMIFFIQAFSLGNVTLTLTRIACSSALSILLIFGIDSLASTHREKRL